MKINKSFGLLIVVCHTTFLTSCVIVTGLDPAEKLAEEIEVKARILQRSQKATLGFEFIPAENKVKKTPHYDGEVTIIVHLNKKDAGYSVIDVNRWFRTTYHNRFVLVGHSMTRTKGLGEPFHIVLKKSDGKINWVDIK